jgi:arabinose-5-phosphate isomerase
MTTDFKFHEIGRSVIQTELEGIHQLLEKIDQQFDDACEIMLNCSGRVVVTGMGKSGHIGNKIAATLSSTGTPAFFMHPAEASHGDLGMITKQDIALAISNSGNTKEILDILPLIKRLGTILISITCNPSSTLAQQANINLNIGNSKEACPLNLAPTTSTTTALVLGDALAMALLKARGFTEQDFALRHPGGTLGRRLLWRIKDIMHTDLEIPKVLTNTPLTEALIEMSRKGMGMTTIVDEDDKIIGIFTDGDLRRTVDHGFNIHQTKIDDVMTKKFTTIKPDLLAVEALHLIEYLKINGFPVVDEEQKLIGALNLHDFLRAGIM